MTPDDLRARREALGITRAGLGRLLWPHAPETGRVAIAHMESGAVPIMYATGRWLDLELSRLERDGVPAEGRDRRGGYRPRRAVG